MKVLGLVLRLRPPCLRSRLRWTCRWRTTRTRPRRHVPQPPAGAPAGEGRAAGPGEPGRAGGRGGGRGNPSAALYTERCSACHGTEGGRTGAEPLRRQWVRAKDDESHRCGDRQRRAARPRWSRSRTQLTDQQIWQIVAYLRTQAATSRASRSTSPIPTARSSSPRSRPSRWRSWRAPRDAVGPRVPAGRPPARHRAARPPPHRRERQAPARAGEGHAESVGAAGRRAARRRGASAVREERLDLLSYSETLPG